MEKGQHIPVLLDEVIHYLDLKKNGIYLDLTLGRGGHAAQILKNIPKGKLICFDKDDQAIKETNSHLSKISNNFILVHSDFSKTKNVLEHYGINKVDGILLDLGVSSPQIDDPERGFSYSKDGPLDMRMDQGQTLSAEFIVNNWDLEKLIHIFKNYADVKLPAKVAKAMIENRPIFSTLKLVEVIKSALPAKILRAKNPSKQVFQALRIAVNGELESLEIILRDSRELLNVNGKLAIITFHSIEDKIVKNFFGEMTKSKINKKLPIQEVIPWKVKTISVSDKEVQNNHRARSAKLRILTRTS